MTDDSLRFSQAAQCLSPRLLSRVKDLEKDLAYSANELRLRLNRPLSVSCADKSCYITESGELTENISRRLLTVEKKDIDHSFGYICEYSVYARQSEIACGFVTLKGGHRVGICGTAVSRDGALVNVRSISSLNIRIAREHKGCSGELLEKTRGISGGILICGPPCSGKTTVLRDLARTLSYKNRVSLIDGRGELAAACGGVFQNDVGMCDVFDGYPKDVAMEQALRSMSPQIIICDELGSETDVRAAENALNCGVRLIATAHAADFSELKNRAGLKRLAALGGFEAVAALSGGASPGTLSAVARAGEVFGF